MIKYILGVAANKTCNADNALKVGQQIIDSMTGCSVEDFVFKKNKQAILSPSKISRKMAQFVLKNFKFVDILAFVVNQKNNPLK